MVRGLNGYCTSLWLHRAGNRDTRKDRPLPAPKARPTRNVRRPDDINPSPSPTKHESNFYLRSTDLYVVHSPPPSGTGSTVRQGATAMGHRHTDTVAFGAGHADAAAAPRQSQTHSHRRGHSSDAGSLISKSSSYGSTYVCPELSASFVAY